MASNGVDPVVSVRGSTGIYLSHGPPNYEPVNAFTRDDSKNCKVMAFAKDGQYFVWCNGAAVKLASCQTWKVVAEIPKPRTSAIMFSPKGTLMVTWEPFQTTPTDPQGSNNLNIWEVSTGKLLKSFVQKKQSEWALQWSDDEKICSRSCNSEVLFYEDNNFEKVVHKIHMQKVANFSLAPGSPPYHVLCYMPGAQGQPSIGRMFEYPKFESTQALANKSFFQAERVEIKWNAIGMGAVMTTYVDVDKSGASYYGKQALHYMDTKKDTALVQLSKEGPIYSVEWNPKSTEFCVVYGFMPAKATIFNLKCESVFDFGTGPRNSVYYNVHGNMLILGGFGNLRGNVEVWNMKSKKMITKLEATDTTDLKWSPDGEHFITATTAPRLRQGNGFKIWHYTGALLYERPWNKMEELWEVAWQNVPEGTFKEPNISYKPVEGIQSLQPQLSKEAYRPPAARGKESTFKLHDDEELPSNQKGDANLTKSAMKNKKYREAKKAKKEQEDMPNGEAETGKDLELTGDPERDKKIKNIKKKLEQITKLKEQQSSGKHLELNQLEKIKKEDELLKELQNLTV